MRDRKIFCKSFYVGDITEFMSKRRLQIYKSFSEIFVAILNLLFEFIETIDFVLHPEIFKNYSSMFWRTSEVTNEISVISDGIFKPNYGRDKNN